MKRKGRKILMFQLFKKLRTVREGQKNRRRKDPADPPVGINRHAAVKGKEEIHSPKGQGVYRQLRTGRPFVPRSLA